MIPVMVDNIQFATMINRDAVQLDLRLIVPRFSVDKGTIDIQALSELLQAAGHRGMIGLVAVPEPKTGPYEQKMPPKPALPEVKENPELEGSW